MEGPSPIEVRLENSLLLISAKDISKKYDPHNHLARNLAKISPSEKVILASTDTRGRAINTTFLTLNGMRDFVDILGNVRVNDVQSMILNDTTKLFIDREKTFKEMFDNLYEKYNQLRIKEANLPKDPEIEKLHTRITTQDKYIRDLQDQMHNLNFALENLKSESAGRPLIQTTHKDTIAEKIKLRCKQVYKKNFDSSPADLQQFCINNYFNALDEILPHNQFTISEISTRAADNIVYMCKYYFEKEDFADCQSDVNITLNNERIKFKRII